MKKLHLATLTALMIVVFCLFPSCKKEEAKHTECDILSAWVEGEAYEQYFYSSAAMRIENIPSNVQELTFTVLSLDELPPIPLRFTLSAGATISPANGSLQDFTQGSVVYTVTSEDGAWNRKYTVTFKEPYAPASRYSFEHVDTVEGSVFKTTTYHVFYEVDADGAKHHIWASGNEGVAIVNSSYTPADYPTRSVDNGYSGRGVCLRTQDAGALARMMGKPIAAGNLFLGRFNVEQVMTNPLRTTEFGIPVNHRPVKVVGYYKYQPGEQFTNSAMKVVEGKVDEASIYALFFRNEDADGNAVVLTGEDLETSPYIISRAEVASLPAVGEWTRFEMTFSDCTPDATALQRQGYSMTIVFSSSKNGDTFEGAIGSTLYVDEVEVTYEAE